MNFRVSELPKQETVSDRKKIRNMHSRNHVEKRGNELLNKVAFLRAYEIK
jgi:hypothetical protein